MELEGNERGGEASATNNDDDVEKVSLLTERKRKEGASNGAGAKPGADDDASTQSSRRRVILLSLLFAFMVLASMHYLGYFESWSTFLPADTSKKGSSEGSSSGGGFTKERLQAVRAEANKLVRLLDEYYDHKASHMLLESPDSGWSVPYNFAKKPSNSSTPSHEDKLVETMARALLDDDQDTFVIGVLGSSVAAGHDNCNYDSYEKQLSRTFSSVWAAANMKLDVQNAGEGGGCGDSYKNQVWCVMQNVAPWADIIHYSWTYFEIEWKEKPIARESLVRWAQMMDRQPPVHILNVQGGAGPNGCYGRAQWDTHLFQHYNEYGYNAFCLKTALYAGGHNYSDGRSYFGWADIGDGYHNTTRYGELETNQERKDSLGVVFRNWHPGPLGFQTVADAFAYTYANAMLSALDKIEDAMVAGQDPRQIWGKRPIMLKNDLPEPLFCDPQYCKVDEPPTCLNFELPHYGWWGSRVADPDDDLNPYKGEVQKWTVWTAPNDKGTYMIPKLEQKLYANDTSFCAHLDACAGISSNSHEDGRVVFKLPKQDVGLVAICGCCGKAVAKDMFIENEYLEVEFNGLRLTNKTWDIFPENKCARVLANYDMLEDHSKAINENGHSYLSIRLLEGNTKEVRISHVITI